MSDIVKLPDKWGRILVAQPEAGMGYQIVTVILSNGRCFEQVVVDSGDIVSVDGNSEVPFDVNDICQIMVTNKR